MGCCTSKRQDKPKPKADFPPNNSQSSQYGKNEAPPQPSSAPAKPSAPPNKSPPRLDLPRASVSKKDPKTYKSAHITITTAYEEKDIIKLEMTPRGTIKNSVHFHCPVCFSYYNVILSTKCCKNYLCHQCAKDMLDRDLKESKSNGCPTCQHELLELGDVDLAASVKLYTDTFALSKTKKVAAGGEEEDSDGLEVRDSPLLEDEPDNRI